METFLKFYHSLMAKGFATAEDRAELSNLAKGLEDVEEKVEEVDALPTEDAEAEAEAEDEEAAAELKKQISDIVAKEASVTVQKQVAEFKAKFAESIEKKAGMFGEDQKAARKAANERVLSAIAALRANDFAALKDLNGGTAADGGYTIDTELLAEIRHLTTEYGVARRECDVLNMGRARQVNINDLATDVSVYWTSEGGAKTSSQFTIGQNNLTLNKLAVIVPWTDELAEDTEIDIISFLAGRISEAMAQKEDEAFFNGDGTSAFGGFTGLLNLAGANSVTLTSTSILTMDADDLIAMVDATPQGALANAKFYMNRTLMSLVRKLKDNDLQYIFQRPSESGPATIWGYPVVLVEAMPTTSDDAADTPFVLFGDLKKAYTLGVKPSGMKMDIATEATIRNVADDADVDLFREDKTALRVVERIGGVGVLENAVTVLSTAAASA